MSREEINQFLVDNDCLIADGFNDAIIGYDARTTKVIYSYDKCVEILMETSGMDSTQAIEYMDFNVTGAYVGEKTPIFLMTI